MTSLADLLPATAVPRPEEGLFGYTSLLDLKLGAPSGTTARMVSLRPDSTEKIGGPARMLLGLGFDLAALARMNGVEEAAVESLTFRRESRALAGGRLTWRTIGSGARFAVCPVCIREGLFVARETVLPGVTGCDRHGRPVRLVSECFCGEPIDAFDLERDPFRCRDGHEWADIRPRLLDDREALRCRRALRAYRWILAHPEPWVFEGAAALAAQQTARRIEGGYELDLRGQVLPEIPKEPFAVATVVRMLVDLNLPPGALEDAIGRARRRRHACLNKTCRADGSYIRSNGRRGGEEETYCALCGSRFHRGRIILSFDWGHGDPHLRRKSVQKARARLARWRLAAFKAGERLRPRRERVWLEDVLREAGVPLAGYLRARRLGIVAYAKAGLNGRPSHVDRYPELGERWLPPWPAEPISPRQPVAAGAGRAWVASEPEDPAAQDAASGTQARRPER